MIIKAQSQKLQREAMLAARPHLSVMERGMLTWAMLEPGDKVLDLNVGMGLMLEYLARHMECEICGVSGNMEDVRAARARLQNADIVYAQAGDIPWRENAFDTVFLRKPRQEEAVWEAVLSETFRVLKPGGQLLLGMSGYPAPLRRLARCLGGDAAAPDRPAFQGKGEWADALAGAGFGQITWRQLNLANRLIIGWKPLGAELEAPPRPDNPAH